MQRENEVRRSSPEGIERRKQSSLVLPIAYGADSATGSHLSVSAAPRKQARRQLRFRYHKGSPPRADHGDQAPAVLPRA